MSVLYDLYEDKISNYIILFGFLQIFVNLIVESVLFGFDFKRIIEIFTGIIFPLILMFPLFYLHMIGTGDIKLFMVIGGFLGIKLIFICIFLSFVIGVVVSIYKMIKYHLFHERFAYFFTYMKKFLYTKERVEYFNEGLLEKCKIHFSVPIASSVAILFVFRGGMFI